MSAKRHRPTPARPRNPEQQRKLDTAFQQAVLCHRSGRLPEAEQLYRQILQISPDHPDALHLLGVIVSRKGEYRQAITLIRKAITRNPRAADYHFNLAIALRGAGKLRETLSSLQHASRLKPDWSEIYFQLGNTLLLVDKPQQAAEHYRRAIVLSKSHGKFHTGLARALHALGDLHGATQALEQASSIAPNWPDPWVIRGNHLAIQGAYSEAESAYRHALTLAPDNPHAHYNLGTALLEQNRLEDAVACFRQTLKLAPRHWEALNNLGVVLADSNRLDEAAGAFRQAATLVPDNLEIKASLISTELKLGDWRSILDIRPTLLTPLLQRSAPGQAGALRPFSLLNLPLRVSPTQYRQLTRDYVTRRFDRPWALHRQLSFQHQPESRQRLRIGYLSFDFRNHATAHLIQGLFQCHDRAQVEILSYSTGPDDQSLFRQRIAERSDHFIDLHRASSADIARRIHQDQVDILVDLNGHTRGARFEVLLSRPAPIQVSYLGFPGTLGSDCVDYLIADASVIPPGEERYYDEQIVRMPHSYQVNDRDRPIAETSSRQDCGLPEEATVFCCFCNTYKLEPIIFAAWMGILRQVPGSVLWLLGKNPTAENNLRAAATAHEVDPGRLVFAPLLPQPEHLARHKLADLALDTHYYNGHTTTSDALWAGLPVITLPGRTFASRVSLGLLRAVGLEELAVDDLAAYEALAVRLATDATALADLKARLAAQRLDCPLFDTERFARDLEQAYRTMWERYCRGEAPVGFDLADQT